MAAKTGDPCPRCKLGRLAIASSQQHGEYQVRYLRCKCGATDKHVLPAAQVRRTKPG
jgi:hypothetical protein